MKKKLAIVTVTLLMGISVVACSKSTDNSKASPSATGDASATPKASFDADTPYTQEQEIEMQSRDITGFVTLGEYKGVDVAAVDATVTDEDVEKSIQSTLENNKTYKDTEKDYKAAKGDQVVIDYVGKIDGKAFDKGSADDQTVVLGDGQYIQGFEDGIIGHTAGTTFDINVTFPENYTSKDLAGKAATFTITLDSIKNPVMPELNDAFVQTVSETSKTVEEYRKEVRASMEENAKKNKESKEEDAVWEAVLAKVEVSEYPEDLIEYYAYNSRKQIITELASSYNTDLDTYLKTIGITEEEFTKEREEDAKAYLKQLMVLQKISIKEGLLVTDEQYQTELKKVLEANNMKTEDDLKGTYGNLVPYTIKKSILYDNVTDWLVSNAKIK